MNRHPRSPTDLRMASLASLALLESHLLRAAMVPSPQVVVEPEPEPVSADESRQVRRARERAQRKGRRHG